MKYKIINFLVPKLIRFFSYLPLGFMQALGWAIGFILSFFPNQLVKIANRNIALCYPELSLLQQRKLVRQSVIQAVIAGAEMPAMFMKNPKKLMTYIKEYENDDLLNCAFDQGKGLLCLGPHIGCWELGGLFLAERFPVFTLYTPPKQAVLSDIITKARSRSGAEMEPASQSGVRHLFKALKDKKAIAMLTDQVPDPDDFGGLYAPFFKIDAWTMSFPSKLYSKRKPPTFIVYAIRRGVGRGFKLVVEPFEYYMKSFSNDERIPDAFTYAMNYAYEKIAKKYPAQYQWTYRRFKHPPKGHPGLYL
ncbi:lysophospholipid acyltransferase family protein [Thiotrichales bacterium 19S3-7]|nr:lysophospholipid acyltransferase family protein [Thiotrichales bacterium 19S3-7]MCF6802919.1 lysophospholipid acyltransferase family protein [Thiotrichales bacterium 19S3-11]